MDTIIEAIKVFIEKKSRIPKGELSNETNLLDSQVLSSMGVLELIVHLENTFDIEFGSDELVSQNYETVEVLAQFIYGKKNTEAVL